MRCEHRGPILIHAGKTLDPGFDELRRVLRERDIHVPPRKELPRGGIVGWAMIVVEYGEWKARVLERQRREQSRNE